MPKTVSQEIAEEIISIRIEEKISAQKEIIKGFEEERKRTGPRNLNLVESADDHLVNARDELRKLIEFRTRSLKRINDEISRLEGELEKKEKNSSEYKEILLQLVEARQTKILLFETVFKNTDKKNLDELDESIQDLSDANQELRDLLESKKINLQQLFETKEEKGKFAEIENKSSSAKTQPSAEGRVPLPPESKSGVKETPGLLSRVLNWIKEKVEGVFSMVVRGAGAVYLFFTELGKIAEIGAGKTPEKGEVQTTPQQAKKEAIDVPSSSLLGAAPTLSSGIRANEPPPSKEESALSSIKKEIKECETALNNLKTLDDDELYKSRFKQITQKSGRIDDEIQHMPRNLNPGLQKELESVKGRKQEINKELNVIQSAIKAAERVKEYRDKALPGRPSIDIARKPGQR